VSKGKKGRSLSTNEKREKKLPAISLWIKKENIRVYSQFVEESCPHREGKKKVRPKAPASSFIEAAGTKEERPSLLPVARTAPCLCASQNNRERHEPMFTKEEGGGKKGKIRSQHSSSYQTIQRGGKHLTGEEGEYSSVS